MPPRPQPFYSADVHYNMDTFTRLIAHGPKDKVFSFHAEDGQEGCLGITPLYPTHNHLPAIALIIASQGKSPD